MSIEIYGNVLLNIFVYLFSYFLLVFLSVSNYDVLYNYLYYVKVYFIWAAAIIIFIIIMNANKLLTKFSICSVNNNIDKSSYIKYIKHNNK